jgi:hypothetical protein
VKKEQEIIDVRAQQMMKVRVEPCIMPTMVKVVPIVIHVAKQTTKVPHMIIPHERQL